MAKERLNELQKWILVKCYEHRDNDFPRGIIARRHLIYISNKITPSFGVSVSRAIWSLIDKGYARGLSPISVDDMAMKDLGVSHEIANKGAGNFMQICFGRNTSDLV